MAHTVTVRGCDLRKLLASMRFAPRKEFSTTLILKISRTYLSYEGASRYMLVYADVPLESNENYFVMEQALDPQAIHTFLPASVIKKTASYTVSLTPEALTISDGVTQWSCPVVEPRTNPRSFATLRSSLENRPISEDISMNPEILSSMTKIASEWGPVALEFHNPCLVMRAPDLTIYGMGRR